MITTDRDLRHRDIVPPHALRLCRTTIIGVGAIGRQVALQLAAMGIPHLTLVDHDIVEPVNLGPQGYLQDDVGRPKVQATADIAQQINHELSVEERQARFRRSDECGDVVFCCVDSIDTRRLIWEAVKDRVRFFSDGRMSAEALRVLTVAGTTGYDHYPSTLFGAAEAYQGSCTAKSTIFTANIAAGLMIEQFTRWLRHLPLDIDVQFNLLTSEINVTD